MTARYQRAFVDRDHADRVFVWCLVLALVAGFAVGVAV